MSAFVEYFDAFVILYAAFYGLSVAGEIAVDCLLYDGMHVHGRYVLRKKSKSRKRRRRE